MSENQPQPITVVIPPQIAVKLEEKARRLRITVQDLVLRAIVKVLEEPT